MDTNKRLLSFLLGKGQLDNEALYIKEMIFYGYSKDFLLGTEKQGGRTATFRKKRKKHDK